MKAGIPISNLIATLKPKVVLRPVIISKPQHHLYEQNMDNNAGLLTRAVVSTDE